MSCAKYCKDGIVNYHQQYKCKECNYRYTAEKKFDIGFSVLSRETGQQE